MNFTETFSMRLDAETLEGVALEAKARKLTRADIVRERVSATPAHKVLAQASGGKFSEGLIAHVFATIDATIDPNDFTDSPHCGWLWQADHLAWALKHNDHLPDPPRRVAELMRLVPPEVLAIMRSELDAL